MKDLQPVYDIIETLCELSDRQFDDKAKDMIRPAKGKSKEEVRPMVLNCINACQAYSLSSAFEILTLKAVYEGMLDGKPEDYGARIVFSTLDKKTNKFKVDKVINPNIPPKNDGISGIVTDIETI